MKERNCTIYNTANKNRWDST